jgi:hypothetical protein
MPWHIDFHPEFMPEFDALAVDVRIEMAALVELLASVGPTLKRPHADTLQGSRHTNMKELRLQAGDGVWRVAFAFDPERKAILLVAGDKSGVSQKRFYRTLITKADERFDSHLAYIRKKESK